MIIGKVEIRFMYEKWPSWAIGFWLYYKWFGLQILMFKLIIQEATKIDIPEGLEIK